MGCVQKPGHQWGDTCVCGLVWSGSLRGQNGALWGPGEGTYRLKPEPSGAHVGKATGVYAGPRGLWVGVSD